MRAILRERLRRANDLITSIAGPLVDTVHITASWNEKSNVLQPSPVSCVVPCFRRGVEEQLRALKILRAVSIAETRLIADQWHQGVVVLLGGIDVRDA
jgi:hypothetical protein